MKTRKEDTASALDVTSVAMPAGTPEPAASVAETQAPPAGGFPVVGEVEALFRDLLIGVTSFFRDPEAFKVLEEQVIPALFAGRPAGAAVRVWCAGCSTGEEAYSLAILLAERQSAMRQSFKMQLYAIATTERAGEKNIQ